MKEKCSSRFVTTLWSLIKTLQVVLHWQVVRKLPTISPSGYLTVEQGKRKKAFTKIESFKYAIEGLATQNQSGYLS